ncbi:hypothetical protein E4U56_002706 [Claviceps arundinis]|uniref:Uncharacterized protein n=1 Tax=Claviceps arundinis TaxID=1623583 RepID=A0A9P7MPT7_9HYPO|nr:hypothetical protein E4U56_002706 [Claviceps arundinis]
MSTADFVPSFELGRRQIISLPIRSAPSAPPVELPRRPDTEVQQISEVEEPVRNQTGDNQTPEALDTATRSLKLKVRKKRRRTAAGSTCFRITTQSRKEYLAEEIRKAKRELQREREQLQREREQLQREREQLQREREGRLRSEAENARLKRQVEELQKNK